ncbi:MAG: patatin-like phospholipase family protein [Methylococcaceae bacterium]|jgi:predicted acylesterase/phospholipase RssA
MTTKIDSPVDRFCDLVMKGGITSGIVYPKAIIRLSHHYRFKNIGGTSAGAIAAAVTAAAEYQRRKNGSRLGFDVLENLPKELQTQLPDTGRSKLLSLFQPQPTTRRLFSVLINSLNRKGTFRRILAIMTGFLTAYWLATLLSVAVATAAGFLGPGWITAVLLLFFLLVVLIGVWVYLDVTRNVVKNGFGLCTGMTEDAKYDALTPWLHKVIQEAAGLKENDPSLTFGDLWKAPGFPTTWLNLPSGTPIRSIDLQMFSTNLAHGRPYIFPFAIPYAKPTRFRDRDRLFFNPEELKPYLPDDVLAWMQKHGKPYQLEESRKGRDPEVQQAIDKHLLEIPDPGDFPVILAARMSLSFPFLFSAVPLWAINYDAPRGEREFHRCWFSDGGISSNFPIHLFDGLVPLWPTFGINLESKIEGRDLVFLPKKYTEGYGERWNLFNEKDDYAARFGGFLSAIVSAMQNWNDNSLARMPGVRDRIARVRLNDNEGGLNLDMEQSIIESIVERGEDAAAELIARYAAQPADGPQPEGWDEQRLVRLCTLLKMLEVRAPGILHAFDGNTAHSTDFAALIDRAMQWHTVNGAQEPPAGFEEPLTPDQAKVLKDAVEALKQLMVTLDNPNAQSVFRAIPEPELRVRPTL